jgi:hypothetical protein
MLTLVTKDGRGVRWRLTAAHPAVSRDDSAVTACMVNCGRRSNNIWAQRKVTRTRLGCPIRHAGIGCHDALLVLSINNFPGLRRDLIQDLTTRSHTLLLQERQSLL